MLAGEPPFNARSAHMIIAAKLSSSARPVRIIRAEVPETLDAVLAKALARSATDRYASARAFGAALAAALQLSVPM